jgi:hypothetical protein
MGPRKVAGHPRSSLLAISLLDYQTRVDVLGKIARTNRETFLYLPGKRCRYREHMNKAETKSRG